MKKMIILAGLVVGVASASMPAAAQNGAPVVAVSEFTNDSNAAWWRSGVGRELSTMLSNEMAATGRFRMVDRAKLGHALAEQDLAASGRVRQGTGARTGQLTGAQYLVQGTVTAYSENTSRTGGGISFKGVRLGGKHKEAYVAVDLQVVDAETGEIAFTRTIEGRSTGGGVDIGLSRHGFGGALSHESNTPAGKAIRGALIEATDYLACVMVDRDGCLREYGARESKRRAGGRRALKLD